MGLKVGQEASFSVQLNGARGLIDAKVHTPSGAIEECYISELDSGENPENISVYLLSVYCQMKSIYGKNSSNGLSLTYTLVPQGSRLGSLTMTSNSKWLLILMIWASFTALETETLI